MRTRALLTAAILPAVVAALAFTPTPAEEETTDCSIVETVETTDEETGEVTQEDVLACPATSYLSGCEGAAGGKVYSQLLQGSVPLSFTAPSESFTAGAGCGTYEEPTSQGIEPGNPFYDLTIEGVVQGNIDELTVELHDIYVASQRAGGDITLNVRVEIDGRSLFGTEELTNFGGDQTATTPRIIKVPITPEASETGISEALRFSVGDIYEQHGIDGKVGDGSDAYHMVRVTLSVPPGVHALVWDATEIPSGIYINQGLQGTVLMYGTGFVIG